MAKVYLVDLNDGVSPSQLNGLLQCVSEERGRRAGAYRFEADRRRCILAAALARYAACLETGCQNSEISFVCNEHGKPGLRGGGGRQFNLAHSGDWVACGWSGREIGIDVQQMEAVDLQVARFAFHPKECEDLFSEREEGRQSLFYDIWTLKEAYVKYLGTGLSTPLDSFRFSARDSFRFEPSRPEAPNFFMYDIDAAHKMAVCTEDESVEGIHVARPVEIHGVLRGRGGAPRQGSL
jgi:4'-phosphopantetheinyl transferase